MSKEDIEAAVKEAEKFAEEDKKNKEAAEVRNSADQSVYQIEKSLTDFGDKVTEEEKTAVTAELDKVKEALKGTDNDAIKEAEKALQTEFYKVAERIYKEEAAKAQAEGGNQQGGDANGASGENFTDADFTDAE